MDDDTRIWDVLRAASGPLCDDCIATVVGWNDRRQAYVAGSRMAECGAIVRASGICSRCGRRKIVNGLPRASVGQVGSRTTGTPEEQRARIVELLREGQLDREAIAAEVGVSARVVSAVEAHVTVSTYASRKADAENDELVEASEVTLGLVRDLQVALRAEIERLESGLRVADGGRERLTDAGRIDITAEDADGATVVIVLKAGTAEPATLTRLLACMDAVAGQDQPAIRGMLIAGDFHPRVVYAVRTIPNIELRRYRYQFTFEAVE